MYLQTASAPSRLATKYGPGMRLSPPGGGGIWRTHPPPGQTTHPPKCKKDFLQGKMKFYCLLARHLEEGGSTVSQSVGFFLVYGPPNPWQGTQVRTPVTPVRPTYGPLPVRTELLLCWIGSDPPALLSIKTWRGGSSWGGGGGWHVALP